MENAGPEVTEIQLPERWAVLEQALREMCRETRESDCPAFAAAEPEGDA